MGPNKFIFSKLKDLKGWINDWNSNNFGEIKQKAIIAESLTKEIEDNFNNLSSYANKKTKNHAHAKLLQTLATQNIFWKQKCQLKYDIDRDRNFEFFHKNLKAKR